MKKITFIIVILIIILTSFGLLISPYEVDWIKLNPSFEGASFVMSSEQCMSCHEDAIKKYHNTSHSRVFNTPGGRPLRSDCESCHGPRSLHVENPDRKFALSDEQYTMVCQQCHQNGQRIYWQSSMHKTSGVECVSCHNVMEKRTEVALLSKTSQLILCSECHSDVSTKMHRNSRHPIQEGSVDCSSCHNVHGAPGRGMLAKGTVNETCSSCHQDKRGPFLWEHAPVKEDCLTCHEPHGSNNRSLLVTLNSSLCMSCHQYGGHVNEYRYNRVSTPYGNGCANCHMAVHGSNHPSGAKFTR